jgi:NTE family protein
MITEPSQPDTLDHRSGLRRRPVVGLALSGGGARGLAHIGVLKALSRAGVPIDCLAGASMGGVIGAAFAAGVPVEEIEAFALHNSRPVRMLRLVDLFPLRHGLITGARMREELCRLLGAETTFADLRIPFAVTAVDLISGEEVVLRDGLVVDAVRASAAVPAVFDPVEIGGRRLVDGGILNNLPVDVARSFGAEALIAVNVAISYYDRDLVDDGSAPARLRIAHNAWRAEAITVNALVQARLRKARPDVLIHPPIPARMTQLAGFAHAETIIAAGEEAAEAALPAIRAAIRPRLRLRAPRVQPLYSSSTASSRSG